MVDRIVSLDRRIGIAVVAVAMLLFLGFVAWGVSSLMGDDGDDDSSDGSRSGDPGPLSDEVGLDGEPIPLSTVVARAVRSTVEALPTPTPVPTPDIASTLQAELNLNREVVQPVVVLSPLDLDADRDPYLTPGELAYFRDLGPRLWTYVQAWLHLQNFLSREVSEWELESFFVTMEEVRFLVGSAPARPRLRASRDNPVDPLVRAYANSIESGMTGVREAVSRFSDAEDVLLEMEGHQRREALLRIVHDVEEYLADFHDAMSSYGCSVCGELFRRSGGGG